MDKQFAVGDKVKIVKKIDNSEIGAAWVDAMDSTIGKTGTVVNILSIGGINVESSDDYNWYYDPASLELVEEITGSATTYEQLPHVRLTVVGNTAELEIKGTLDSKRVEAILNIIYGD